MKYFDLDWPAALAGVEVWGALSPAVRVLVLKEMQPSQGATAGRLGDALGPVLASGFAERKGSRVVPRPAYRPLLAALRAMKRRRVWEDARPAVLAAYLEEHFTVEEVQSLLPGRQPLAGSVARGYLADLASSEEWVEGFLAAEKPAQAEGWERERVTQAGRRQLRFSFPRVHETTRRMVRELLALPGPIPLRELAARFPGVDAPTRAAALYCGLRYLLLFAALRGSDLEPMVGPWPEAVQRLRGAGQAPPPPAPVEPAETFDAAWLLEDLTTVLVAASGEGLRLRTSDGAVFARAAEALGARLVRLPPWLAEATGAESEKRVEMAAYLLSTLGLARRARRGEKLVLEPTPAGAAWLAGDDRERLAGLLDPLRKSEQRNPASWYESGPPFPFFPVRIDHSFRGDARTNARAALSRVLLALPEEGFVPLTPFVEHARRTANPFLALAREGSAGPHLWGAPPAPRREWERVWGELLTAFLLHRLGALGGARLGCTVDGELCFALTGAGRYLLGGAESFAYGHVRGKAEVIVQPNFEIVFLAPSPPVEARLARLAERVGPGPGVMFRLTRASVLAAAEAGMGEAQVLDALRAAATRELPANVVRQVGDWIGAVRRVQIRPALLLECPDAETAARVRGAAGKEARLLSKTVLELPQAAGAERSALVRKLRASGIFVS